MNPIEYLKQNGYDPDNFRTGVSCGSTPRTSEIVYPHSTGKVRDRQRVSKRRTAGRCDTPDIPGGLLDMFLIAKGWTSNGKTNYGPLIPYLLADLVMLTYEDYLKSLKGAEKFHCNKMMKAYRMFIKDFFRCFTGEYVDKAVDLMSEFEEYMHNDLEIFRFCVQGPLMEYPEEFRSTLSAICVCRLLCSQADLCYSSMYYDQWGNQLHNHDLGAMEHHSRMMFIEFTKRDAGANVCNIDLSDFPNIKTSMERVNDKILKFIKEYDRQQSNG